MSAKLKMKIRNVKTTRKSTKRARVSSTCTCRDDQQVAGQQVAGQKSAGQQVAGQQVAGQRSCGRRQDPAVDAMQEAGKELSDIFRQLRNEDVAERFVRAIRCRDARAVQMLLDCNCRVVDFFSTRDQDCVRICCAFGRYSDVTTTFDICVRSIQDDCRRNNFWF
ncbi:hypothetical protein [Paenibacillus prosopidis]|uniref:Uncharacterized protein n=1 Tax=Paenibacillus prosopidis TaxID=630520 RepID=A0A368W1Q1_9BACL|nr:hypothetical protein [Paenibacillus prosopidis]RCW47842.1 hypothetical protein DFP97_10741 [Paenibacillus prosopidis]